MAAGQQSGQRQARLIGFASQNVIDVGEELRGDLRRPAVEWGRRRKRTD